MKQKIGYHPRNDKQLFTVRPERMEQYSTIPDEDVRYWFALDSWLDEIDVSCYYSAMPSDFSELAKESESFLIKAIKERGRECLGEFQGYYDFLERNKKL